MSNDDNETDSAQSRWVYTNDILAAVIVTLGMAFHFGLHLIQFLARRAVR